MSTTAIIKTPVQYLPSFKDGKFIDDLSEITAMMFKQQGVICECSGCSSKKHIYNNKYSFVASHCKSARHKKYLANLTTNKEHILKTAILRRDEIRRLKIAVGKVDQRNHQLINELDSKNTQISRLKEQVEETNELINQQKEYHNVKYKTLQTVHKSTLEENERFKNTYDTNTDKIKQLESKNTELENKIQTVDSLWNKLGQALGYEVEISHE